MALTTQQRLEIVIDSLVPAKLARFWADALAGYAIRPYDDKELARLATMGLTPETDTGVAIDGDGPTLWFQKTDHPKTQRNRLHFDICVEERPADVLRRAVVDPPAVGEAAVGAVLVEGRE